ncbi:hypothetical protein [Acinetobacter ursingii]|uniref:hypothetical protein n=1 Tax=Acinetobacter ursingii TaxID=108980 RepID=UPI00124F8AEF|nr:hypothetical protein [Acinetobacter ursingii]
MKSLRKQKKRFSLKEHKSKDNSKELGKMLGESIRKHIKSEQQKGGLLNQSRAPKDLDVSTTTIEHCRKRLVDKDGIVESIRPLELK